MSQQETDFGAYVLERPLGKGGMAWVYLARQKALDRHVAIKILFPQFAEEDRYAARFEREARTAGRMAHENIGLVHDYGRHEGRQFLVMEYIEGVNLREWLEQHGPPPLEIALLILRDVSRALEHAHAPGRDVIHRDLKPSNVMLAKDGMVKLLDFGLARAVSEDVFRTVTEGLAMGTVPYMSPEQAAGKFPDGDAGKLSDIFSLGIVFFELLGGRRPFIGDHQSEITRAIQTDEPPALESLNPLVPTEVAGLVARMLAKAPQRRVQRVSEAVTVLQEALRSLSVHDDRQLMRDYVSDPVGVGRRLQHAAAERHLQRGLHFKTLGHAGIEDALREFRQVAYLDQRNKVAAREVAELESEIRNRRERQGRSQPRPDLVATVRDKPTPPRGASADDPTIRIESRGTGRPAHRAVWIAGVAALLVIVAIILRAAGWPGRQEASARMATSDPADSVVRKSDKVTPPLVTTGSLAVETDPPTALVSVDGGPPTARRLYDSLAAGSHEVRVSARGYESASLPVQVVAGQVTPISVSLATRPAPAPPAPVPQQAPKPNISPGFGYLKVTSTTDYFGQIWVDGQDTGRQNTAVIRLKQGPHLVKILRPGFRTAEGEVRVEVIADDTASVKFAILKEK